MMQLIVGFFVLLVLLALLGGILTSIRWVLNRYDLLEEAYGDIKEEYLLSFLALIIGCVILMVILSASYLLGAIFVG